MKKYATIVFILFFWFFIFPPGALSQSVDRHAALEEKKLELEIEKLEEESRSSSLVFWSTILGSLIGAATIIWTIYSGIRTMKQQIEQRRDERISSLMEKLSADSMSLRLGAVRGLSRYADDALPELLAAASTEKSVTVRGALEDTLTAVDADHIGQIVRANSRSLPKRIHLMGRFSQLSSKNEGLAFGFLVDDVKIQFIKSFRVEYQHGQRLQTQRKKLPDLTRQELNELHQIRQSLLGTVQITAGVLARWIRAQRRIPWPDTGLDLAKSNLYQGLLENIKSQNILLTFSILRHSHFRNCQITESDFSQSELYDSTFENCEFYRCYFQDADLRSITANGVVFAECILKNAVFSESDLRNSDFCKSDARKGQFNGAMLENADFSNAFLHKAKFKGAFLSNARLNQAELFRSDLEAAILKNISARNAKFNGANLEKTSFEGADLRNANFSGARLSRANFTGANLTGAQFYECKNFDSAIFDVIPASD